MKNISILGSTGSIGTQCLDVIRENRESFRVCALTCGQNLALFRDQLAEFSPGLAVCRSRKDAETLGAEFPDIRFASGLKGICEAASYFDADMVVNALSGMMGIAPTMDAIKAGKDIAFANKETLVAAGEQIMDAVADAGVAFLPVDSEHSAIFQCVQASPGAEIKRIILTGSGGPFRGFTKEQLGSVTVEQALCHPKWSMGKKITIDSATLMNKGLEMIEAYFLFGAGESDIEVVIHPQSVLHSAVEFSDGSVIGQMAEPDMKLPIAYALSWPERLRGVSKSLDLLGAGRLDFEKPDEDLFPCLSLARTALREGQACRIAMNAANEEAVWAFLAGRVGFTDIPAIIERCMDMFCGETVTGIEDVYALEARTRAYAKELAEAL